MTAPEKLAGSIVCVNLNDEGLRTVRMTADNKFEIHLFRYDDVIQVQKYAKRALALFLYWDANGRVAHDFLNKILRNGSDYQGKIFIVMPAGFKGRKFTAAANQEFGIKRWIQLPMDLIVIQRHLEEAAPEIMTGSSEGEAPVLASGAEKKTDIIKVIGLLNRKWAHEEQRRDFLLEEGDRLKSSKRIFVMHGASAKQAADLAQIVFDAGYKNVESFHQASLLVSESIFNPPDAIIYWYDEKQDSAIRAMEHIIENRETAIPRQLVVYPGERALNSLVKTHSHLFFDTLFEFSRNREKFRTALHQLFSKDKLEQESATLLLRRLRNPDLTLRNAEGLCTKLKSKPGKAYWAKAEYAHQLIKVGNYRRAIHEAKILRRDYPDYFDPILLENEATRLNAPKKYDAENFVEAIRQLTTLSLPRIYRVARKLYLWRQPDGLRSLLDFWDAQDNLPSDYHYMHAAACYYRMVGMKSLERDHILLAITQRPLVGDFLDAAATNLADLKQYQQANELLRFAMQSGTLDNRRLTLTLARNLVDAGQSEKAAKLMEELMQQHPDYEPAKRVYRRLFSSLLDVS